MLQRYLTNADICPPFFCFYPTFLASLSLSFLIALLLNLSDPTELEMINWLSCRVTHAESGEALLGLY